ncbi:MAG: hypothetical protein ACAH17_02830 [Candidatus Paceibacterota bacterium]
MKDYSHLGVQPASRLSKVEDDFIITFYLVSAVLGLMMSLFVYEQFTGAPVHNTGLMLGCATSVLALRGVNFLFLVQSEYDPDRKLIRLSESFFGLVMYFFCRPGTIFAVSAFGFAFALHYRSMWYLPLLASAMVTFVVRIVSLIATCATGAKGGGAGFSPEDFDEVEEKS